MPKVLNSPRLVKVELVVDTLTVEQLIEKQQQNVSSKVSSETVTSVNTCKMYKLPKIHTLP